MRKTDTKPPIIEAPITKKAGILNILANRIAAQTNRTTAATRRNLLKLKGNSLGAIRGSGAVK